MLKIEQGTGVKCTPRLLFAQISALCGTSVQARPSAVLRSRNSRETHHTADRPTSV